MFVPLLFFGTEQLNSLRWTERKKVILMYRRTLTSVYCSATLKNKPVVVCINERLLAARCPSLLTDSYICNEMHCPSSAGRRAAGTRWFLFVLSVCRWGRAVGSCSSKNQQSSSPGQAGDYLCSAVAPPPPTPTPPSRRALSKKTR